MSTRKPWTAKGVALYPPQFSFVGQNHLFNALVGFRRSLWDGTSSDIAGFFVVYGDWGLGKTRLGYELIAEATGHSDEWCLNKSEHVAPPYHQPGRKARVLEPALQDGILPLLIRYSTVCNEALTAADWVPRVSLEALRQTLIASPLSGGTSELYQDLKNVMHARGIDLKALDVVHDARLKPEERLIQAKKVLAAAGIKHLWIIVDEVETPGDLKKGFRDDSPSRIDDEFLLMVSEVIKHENWRSLHPEVNFILLCSMGMKDQIQIGPNLRRAVSAVLEPNQVTDVRNYVNRLKESIPDPKSVDYPPGTLEGAFLAVNRNFGWLNVVMAAVHEAHARRREQGESVESWQLLKEFASNDGRARHIFTDNEIFRLIGSIPGVSKELIERLIYGQLPAPVGGMAPGALSQIEAAALFAHEIPGRGVSFAELVQVHIDERALAHELTRPEIGFKAKEGRPDEYGNANCELSVVGLLEALRAFSVAVMDPNEGESRDFVVYRDLDQWSQQLLALYPRENIAFAAESLHRIFLSADYKVDGQRFIGMSFGLWKNFNKLLGSGGESPRFFREGKHDLDLESYLREISATRIKRGNHICLGLAKLLDDQLKETRQLPGLKSIPHQAFTSGFTSPVFDGLRVTPDGRCVITYCLDSRETLECLKAILGTERVQPILVLFPPNGDVVAFEEQVKAYALLERCVITRRMTLQDEELLLKYSGRGSKFDPQKMRLSNTANGLIKSHQEDWQARSREWAHRLRHSGYLLAPLWNKAKNTFAQDFSKGYRFMVAYNCSLDSTIDSAGGPLTNIEFENLRSGIKKNADAPSSWHSNDLLEVVTRDGSNLPVIPRAFLTVLYELRSQSNISKLISRFFFNVPESEIKVNQQLEQLLELLIGLGVVRKSGDFYKAIDPSDVERRRQSATSWLKGECKQAIKQLGELFPNQTEILLNGAYPEANQKLDEADRKIRSIDFTSVTGADPGSLSENAFAAMVKGIMEVEKCILEVCPLEIGDGSGIPFDCSPARIATFETRFNQLSLWERVSFLAWLRGKFSEIRDSMTAEVDGLLGDAAKLDQVDGEPFPVLALTLPLKAIRSELELTLSASSGAFSRRAEVGVKDLPLQIQNYLVQSKYESAWKRLEALSGFVQKANRDSYFARFSTVRETWKTAIQAFRKAEAAWKQVESFVVDGPTGAQKSVLSIKADIQKYGGIVRGGLRQSIQNQCDDVAVTELLDLLTTEVNASVEALGGLEGRVRSTHEELLTELRKHIHEPELRALNRLLAVSHQPSKQEPKPQSTYSATRLEYEKFNQDVRAEGRRYFEETQKTVSFSLWCEIYSGLESKTYDEDQHPDHAEAIRELKSMKLLRSRLELR